MLNGLGVCTVGCSISFVFVNINKINFKKIPANGKDINKINFQKGEDDKKSCQNIYPWLLENILVIPAEIYILGVVQIFFPR